jgi:hypothetical protein
VFTLDPGAPESAALHAQSGEFLWQPMAQHRPGPHPFTVRVTDDGVPPLSATASFQVSVLPRPRLGAVTRAGSEIRISWPGLPGKHFQVQYTADLAIPHWLNLGPPVSGAEDTLTLSDTIQPGEQRFYRVVLVEDQP